MLKPVLESEIVGNEGLFAEKIVVWFRGVGKSYPWRLTSDPYAIFISEVMLQQTTVASVLSKGFFARFLKRFPTLQDLAEATEEEVLATWQGLGYYSRARNLRKAAIYVVNMHDGKFPQTHAEILELPGVGLYTAGAIASFAYNLPEAIVDGNVARVLSRILDMQERIDSTAGQRRLWETARTLVPKAEARLYNSGLMELGQTLCSKGVPQCIECPVAGFCKTRTPEELPRKKSRRKMVQVDEAVSYIVDEEGAVLLEQESGTRRRGFWKLPEHREDDGGELLLQTKYVITHHKVSLDVYGAAERPLRDGERWVLPDELNDIPVGAPYRKVIDKLANGE